MAKKDWTGSRNSIYRTLGASNHTQNERESNDYYATEPKAAELLLKVEDFSPNIWECACGGGHLAEVFKAHGYNVTATDLIDRGYGKGGVDFLRYFPTAPMQCDIITNPPYKYAKEFVEHALDIIADGHKVAMLLKLQFLEGKERKKMFEKYPPRVVYVSSSRLHIAMNGEFERYRNSNAVAYAWYVWQKGYAGETIVKWIN